MYPIAIVYVNNSPTVSFWQLADATNYIRRMLPRSTSITITLQQLDILPWETALHGRRNADELQWLGAATSEIDTDTLYVVPLI